MIKQALTEALALLDGRDYLVRQDLVEQGFEAWIEVTAAARWRERLLPGGCGSCPPMNHQLPPNERPFCICATCHGTGQVWDEGIVEAVAGALWGRRQPIQAYRDEAVAVLSALVELLTEKVE